MKLLLPSPNCVFDTICYFFDAFVNIPPANWELPAIDWKPMKEFQVQVTVSKSYKYVRLNKRS